MASSMSRLVVSLLGASYGMQGAHADHGKTSFDSVTFGRMVLDNKEWAHKSVVLLKKKYGYDSQDLIEQTVEGLRFSQDTIAFDVELDLEPPRDDDVGEDEPSEWQIKDKKGKANDKALADRLGISSEAELPLLLVIDGQQKVDQRISAAKKLKILEKKSSYSEEESEPVNEDEHTSFQDVTDFLRENGINLAGPKQELGLAPEEKTLITEFAKAETSALQDIVQKMEALDNIGSTSEMLVRVMKSAAKFGSVSGYIEKEEKRVGNMIASKALTQSKKEEMMLKKRLLLEIADAAKAPEAQASDKDGEDVEEEL
ncbi:unnamed protein product [Amoebophrya sp. A25]|nr:unnamed protein product [Amoebophrya sp. A25]|eukprot:GSA25T00024648001.1